MGDRRLLRRACAPLVAAFVVAACSQSATVSTPTATPVAPTAPAATVAASASPEALSTDAPIPAGSVAGGAQLSVLSGAVAVSHGTSEFSIASEGDMLASGDTVQASDTGRAVLTFSDGSTVELEPLSSMTIDTLDETPDGGIVVSVTLLLGKSWHVVSPLGASSAYQVKTLAGTAKVKGTQFQVSVVRGSDQPSATIETSEGTVVTTAAGGTGEVAVPKGTTTTVRKGDARPAAPKQIPEPSRKATTTIADENGLVIDAAGRANGYQDGRLVLQTPGAHVQRENGKLIVTLPEPPDGALTTVVGGKQHATDADKVNVETKIEERGSAPQTMRQTVGRGAGEAAGLELKKTGGKTAVRQLGDKDRGLLKAPKVPTVPDRGRGRPAAPGQQRSSGSAAPSVRPSPAPSVRPSSAPSPRPPSAPASPRP